MRHDTKNVFRDKLTTHGKNIRSLLLGPSTFSILMERPCACVFSQILFWSEKFVEEATPPPPAPHVFIITWIC